MPAGSPARRPSAKNPLRCRGYVPLLGPACVAPPLYSPTESWSGADPSVAQSAAQRPPAPPGAGPASARRTGSRGPYWPPPDASAAPSQPNG